MIYLYTEKQDSDEWILKNDLYFNLYTGNQLLTQEDKFLEVLSSTEFQRIIKDIGV